MENAWIDEKIGNLFLDTKRLSFAIDLIRIKNRQIVKTFLIRIGLRNHLENTR